MMDQHGGEILDKKIRQKKDILEQCDRLWRILNYALPE